MAPLTPIFGQKLRFFEEYIQLMVNIEEITNI